MEETFDWRKQLDLAGETAFADLDCGSDGLKKKDSAEVTKTLYELYLADEKQKLEAEMKKKDAQRETAELILDGIKTGAFIGISGTSAVIAAKNYHKLLALDDSVKVISQKAFQWNTNQILKAAMSTAARLVHF